MRRAEQWSYERTKYLLESERSEEASSVKAARGNEENNATVKMKWMKNREKRSCHY